MSTNDPGQKGVTLYRIEPPHGWMTDAMIQPNGDLVITDGDTRHEWTLTISAAEKSRLIDALLPHGIATLPNDPDERLLAVLAARFATGSRCYHEIEAFVRFIGIEARASCWMGSSGTKERTFGGGTGRTEAPATQEFRSSRRYALMLLAFAALWAAAGISTVHDELWEPIVSFAFGAASIFVALANMILHPAIVRLDDDGVHFRHWRMAWSVAWTDIADVRFFTVRINGITTQLNVVVRERDGTEHRVSSGLTISQRKLAALIRQRRDTACGDRETA